MCPVSAQSTVATGGQTTTSSAPVATGTLSTGGSGGETTTALATTIPTVPASTVITTVDVYTTTTVCPVTLTQVSSGVTSLVSTITTSTLTTSSTHVTTIVSSAGGSSGQTTTSSAAVSTETAPCPDVLPSCMQSWVASTECENNADVACLCQSSTFVCGVYGCLAAWGESSEIPVAATFLQGKLVLFFFLRHP